MFRKIKFCTIAALALLMAAQTVHGQIASEDFDGNAVNLISGFDSADNIFEPLFPYTMFGVFETDEFNLTMQAPFALTDDTIEDVSGGGDNPPFDDDTEGIFGMARAGNDGFFTAVAAGDFNQDYTLDDFVANWQFDVSSALGEPLTLSIDMGQMSNDAFDGVPGGDFANFVTVEYGFDGGPLNEAMVLAPIELVGHPSGFQWRAMDNGVVPGIDDFDKGNGTHLGLEVITAGVTKTLADSGTDDNNTILNKTPASGTGAGLLDTFSVPLTGSGNTLELRFSCDFDFEAFAMDNIRITSGNGNVLKGDVNLDGEVNLLDVQPFVTVLADGIFQAEADTNCDGEVNLLDVESFIALLGGG